ncbi:MAG: Hsp20/alpha crystallin family protein [Firmicutes bacterium]|nr:Hsp20/alpha crystallin family protein [Bacillota bacterium]
MLLAVKDQNKVNTQKPVRFATPYVNIRETDKEVILEAEMPGLEKGDLELEVRGDELTITGKRQNRQDTPKNWTPLVKEIETCDYKRTFMLSGDLEKEKINAKYENGVLTLTIPKSEKVQPKRIPIH